GFDARFLEQGREPLELVLGALVSEVALHEKALRAPRLGFGHRGAQATSGVGLDVVGFLDGLADTEVFFADVDVVDGREPVQLASRRRRRVEGEGTAESYDPNLSTSAGRQRSANATVVSIISMYCVTVLSPTATGLASTNVRIRLANAGSVTVV